MDYNFDRMGIIPMSMSFNSLQELIDFLSEFDSHKKDINNMISSNGYTKGRISFDVKFDSDK